MSENWGTFGEYSERVAQGVSHRGGWQTGGYGGRRITQPVRPGIGGDARALSRAGQGRNMSIFRRIGRELRRAARNPLVGRALTLTGNPLGVLAGQAITRRAARATPAMADMQMTMGSVSRLPGLGNPRAPGPSLPNNFWGGGQPQKRRRAKGITGAQLKAFTRVTGILNKYCKAPPPRRRAASRSTKCR